VNDDLCEFRDVLDELVPVPGVISVCWNRTSKCWRIQLDQDDFLREFDFLDDDKEPGNKYPYELAVSGGPVEVFCLVKKVPE